MLFNLDCEINPGEPLILALEDIDEDPEQPRREFDAGALQELAETIKLGGVRQPISVRVNPNDPERWMLNFGARRLRASKLAGKTEIPAFVDKAASGYDQVIENEQREGLTPLELALFVQKRLAEGESQAEIARRLGKSKMYVTYGTALINAPDWLMSLYREGRCRGVRELHELRRLHEVHPDCVQALQSEPGPVTRERVASLKAALTKTCQNASTATAGDEAAAAPSTGAMTEQAIAMSAPLAAIPKPKVAPPETKQAVATTDAKVANGVGNAGPKLLARFEDSIVEVATHAVPSKAGQIFIATPSGGLQAVAAASLQLLRIVAR